MGKVLGGGALRHTSVCWGWGGGSQQVEPPTFPLLSCAGVKERTQGTLCTASPRSPKIGVRGGSLPFSKGTVGSARRVGGLARGP